GAEGTQARSGAFVVRVHGIRLCPRARTVTRSAGTSGRGGAVLCQPILMRARHRAGGRHLGRAGAAQYPGNCRGTSQLAASIAGSRYLDRPEGARTPQETDRSTAMIPHTVYRT